MRKIACRTGPVREAGTDAVILALEPGQDPDGGLVALVDAWTDGALGRRIRQGGFRGEADEALFLATGAEESPHVVAVGVGRLEDGWTQETLRSAAGRGVRIARRERAESLGFAMPRTGDLPADQAAQAVAEGLGLGDWSLDDFLGTDSRQDRPPPPKSGLVLVDPEIRPDDEGHAAGTRRGGVLAECQNYARRLVAHPPNVVTPSYLAAQAEKMALELPLQAEVWGPAELRAQGFGALLAVSRGSTEEPRFIRLEYAGSGDAPVVLAGKGVTFDSGGISLKPPKGMEDMKYDMAGAATVLGALRAVARLELPVHVVGLIPSAENLPSGSALKPSEVIRGVSETSIEVVNTDAEGRLLLSDALAYAGRLEPRTVVDVATLTGGCVVALGHHAIGLMGNDDEICGQLAEAGDRTGERVWRLPLWDPYRDQLDSDIADIKNSGGREASVITAGWFLKEFVGDSPWAHLDIAGTAWTDEERAYHPAGATGVGVRLLVDWLRASP